MELGEIMAKVIWLQSPAEVRMMAHLLMDFSGDELLEMPESIVLATGEMVDYINELKENAFGEYMQMQYAGEFGKFTNLVNSLKDSDPLVVKATPEMMEQMDKILAK